MTFFSLPHALTRAVYTLTLALLYAVILAGQLLGLAVEYRPVPVVLFTTVVFIIVARAYWIASEGFYQGILSREPEKRSRVDLALGVAGAALIGLLILLPIARWPYSPVSESLHWDAGIYHLPKALEMVRSASAWDLSISYGEYPFGYESVLAFPALLLRNGFGFGAAHALTCLYFILTFWVLLRRYSGLASGLTLFLSALVMVSGFFPELEPNFWWMFKFLFFTVGKNDLFLGAALLAVLLHAPVGSRKNSRLVFPLGLALTTMIALATKPNSLFVALPVWLLYLWQSLCQRDFRLKEWIASAVLILPGLLWVGRNLLAQGYLFSPEVMAHQQLSIAANLTNPYLLENIPRTLYAALAIFLVTLILVFVKRWISPSLALAFFLVLAGFALSPASGFYQDTLRPAEINWRFGITVLAFMFFMPVAWVSPWIEKLYAWIQRRAALASMVGLAALALAGGILWRQREVLEFRPKNEIVLYDQFRESVGTDGYFSAYDYIHQNVRNSVVWVENGLPYYAYGPGFTNSTTQSRRADYLVIFQTPWLGVAKDYPPYLSDPEWLREWEMVYADPEGRVYRRIQE